MNIQITTERFGLREITVDDVTARYLGWFSDPDTSKYITAATQTRDLSDLRKYVRERIGRDDVLFLAIVDQASGLHVGNIKYEPVNTELGYAVMGVMIGDPDYRGRGVTLEALRGSARWLKDHRNISQIVLGVSPDNLAAIRVYEKAGFVHAATPHIPQAEGAVTMVWSLR